MHPITSRFLSFSSSKKTLLLIQKEMPLDSEELCFLQATQSRPDFAQLILNSKSNKPEGVQRALFWLSLKAALVSLQQHPSFLPEFSQTQASLLSEGATEEQMESLFLSCLFEEAYESEHDFAEFDAAFVLESLQTLSLLASFSEQMLENLKADFGQHFKTTSATPLSCFHAFFHALFEDGLELPSEKHLETLFAHAPLLEQTELHAFLDFLELKKIVGPLRKQKLASKAEQLSSQMPQAPHQDG